MKYLFVFAVVCIMLVMPACKQKQQDTANSDKRITLRFTMDKDGNVVEQEAKAQILQLGRQIHETGDKWMLHVYTEQLGSVEANKALGEQMARAVKQLTKTQGERSYYNLGVHVHGYENPIDSLHASSMKNRRVEVRPL